jgi:glucose/arabinose dehydrogenase
VRLLSKDLKLREAPAADVNVAAIGEGGLLGLAVDPQFERNSFVYLYRTTDSGNEVLRYRFADGRLEEDGRVLHGLQAAPIHDGGRLRFGPDGLLYVTTGEAGNPPLAQDPGSLNGKILRLRGFRDGPAKAEIVSSGHRNVQGLDWIDGRLLITEFGPDSDDEVNVIRRGANYGWPDAQGNEGAPKFEEPLVNYEAVIAPSGATFVHEEGSAWTGNFIFATLRGEQLRRLEFDGEKVSGDEVLFEGDFGRLRTVTEGPGGSLYVLTNNTDGRGTPRQGDDRVIRIEPPGTNGR